MPLVSRRSSSQSLSGVGASQSSQSSQSSIFGSKNEDDQRFAELLRPIKDLTANWEVPLSRYLDEYIEDLTELNINLDGQNTQVNFAQAALLLQGTASVYSKKVDFLWQNVLKMLELLASRRALAEATDEGGEGGPGGGQDKSRRKKGGQHDFNDFRLVSAEVSRSTNLKTDAAASERVRDRKLTLNFISITPRQLIEKEGKEQKCVRVNLYAKNASKDLIGHKEDFRVNAQFTFSTAAIGEELGVNCELGQQSVSLCDESLSFIDTHLLQPELPHQKIDGADNLETNTAEANTSTDKEKNLSDDNCRTRDDPVPDDGFDQLVPNEDVGDGDLHDGFDNDGADFGMDMTAAVDNDTSKEIEDNNNEEASRKSKRRRDKLQENLDEPKAPLAEPWEPVKPHDALAPPPKPARKGRTSRQPKAAITNHVTTPNKADAVRKRKRKGGQEEQAKNDRIPVIVPVEEYLMHDFVRSRFARLGKAHLLPDEFSAQAETEAKERKKRLTSEGEQKAEDDEEDADKDEEANDPEVQNGLGEGVAADDDGWEDFPADVDAEEDLGLPETHLEHNDLHLLGAMLPESEIAAAATESAEKEADSYEELVMKRVAEYVQQSQEYLESTDLARRVSRWHDDIRPRLDNVEKRGHFDIHKYGSDILTALQGPSAESSSSSSPAQAAKTTLPFADFAKGREREEVCRYFLSSLMLANTYNVGLDVPTNDKDDGSGLQKMDSYQMTLLSTVRHHENLMEDYESPKADSPKRKPVGARGGKKKTAPSD